MERLEDLNLLNLKIYQDDNLYCFTSDAVILSHFARVKKGDVVADFCSGSGIVGLNLFGLNSDKIQSVTLFEMQKQLFELSQKSIEYNKLKDVFSAKNVKLQGIDKEYACKFSLIVCNPPYVKKESSFSQNLDNISVCKSELTLTLNELISAVKFALKPNGRVCLVHRADRVVDIVSEMRANGIEPKLMQFIGSSGKAPYSVLIEGVKGGKHGLKLLPTLENSGSSIN